MSWAGLSLLVARVVAGLALWVPIMIARHPQQLPSGNLGGWEGLLLT